MEAIDLGSIVSLYRTIMWSVSLLLCGDSPGCSSHERADTYAQSNLSAVLSRSQERGKIARNQISGSRVHELFDVISPP